MLCKGGDEKDMPDFELTSLDGSTKKNISEFIGEKPVLIDFYTTW